MRDMAISGGAMSAGRGGVRFDAFTALGLLIVVWLGVTAWLLFRPAKGLAPFPEEPAPASAAAAPPAEKSASDVTEPQPITKEEAQAVNKALSEQPDNPIVRIETTLGTILARLRTDLAPKTAENFLDLLRVGKQLLERRIAHVGRHVGGHEGFEVGGRRQRLGIGQRRRRHRRSGRGR